MAIAMLSPVALPGPRPMPLVGSRGNSIRFFNDQIGYMRDVYKHYGNLAGFVNGGYVKGGFSAYSVFAFGPEYNRQLLSDQMLFYSLDFGFISKPGTAHRRLWTGLLTMNGELHKQQRRMIMPSFHKKRVESYHNDMVTIAAHVLDSWQPGQQLDFSEEMHKLTLQIATKTLFGLDTSQEAADFGVLIKRWIDINATPLTFLFPYALPGSPYRTMHKLSEKLEAGILSMIERKRASGSDQGDVLSMLLQAHDVDGGQLSDTELIGETTILFLAGHETSSNALSWTLFLLTQHPAIYADLVDELESVLHGDAPSIEQLAQLPLLERVIKESMRLLPPASTGLRISTNAFQLGPYYMPAGTVIRFSEYITHHMPELYPLPEQFQPERWNTTNASTYTYLPFGGGPRMCIGSTFALMEIKIILAMLLQRYRLELVPNARIDRKVRITLTPKYGVPVIVHRQDRAFTKNPVRGNIHEMVEL